MVRFLPVSVLLAVLCAAGSDWAQSQSMPGMPGMAASPPAASPPAASAPAASPTAGAADKDLMGSMDAMNKAMATTPMTGDVDQDFVAMMIPHHQGAIDMCKVELREGKDPMLKKLCRAVITAQAKEIATMQHWQRQHPVKH